MNAWSWLPDISILGLLPNRQLTAGLFGNYFFSYFEMKKPRLKRIKSLVQVPKTSKNKVRIQKQVG